MPRCVAFFIVGMLLGAAVMNLALGKRMETLYWEKENLQLSLYETAERLTKLEQQRMPAGPVKVEEIEIKLKTDEGPFTVLALKQKIHEITDELIGEEVASLNHYLVLKLLDGRVLEVEGKRQRLRVKILVLGPTLTYHVEAEPLNERQEENGRV